MARRRMVLANRWYNPNKTRLRNPSIPAPRRANNERSGRASKHSGAARRERRRARDTGNGRSLHQAGFVAGREECIGRIAAAIGAHADAHPESNSNVRVYNDFVRLEEEMEIGAARSAGTRAAEEDAKPVPKTKKFYKDQKERDKKGAG